MLRGNRTIGIVREVYTKWERRAPLCPSHVEKLVQGGIRVLVQPSKKRVFNDAEYASAGAEMCESLDDASVILGVKQVPPEELLSDRTYVFFSHVIKAQPENMKLLDALCQKNVRLIDYECITEGGLRTSPRLIAFGGYAGRAGMVNTLRGVGERMLAMGYSTPFLNMASTYMYTDLPAARAAVAELGQQIATQGLPRELSPFTVVFTGDGNVSRGAQEIFRLLPHKMVTPAELAELQQGGQHDSKLVYGCVVKADAMVRRRDGGAEAFSRREYYEDPSAYEPCFHETLLPHTSLIMNCAYWDPRFPRLVTSEQLQALRGSGNKRLIGVGDVTCDVRGNIEFFEKSTQVEKPFYLYDSETGETRDALDGEGVMMMGVDILPSELPRESSQHFGDHLTPFIPALAESDGRLPLEQQQADLPAPLFGAIITSHGELTPPFSYIQKMRAQRERTIRTQAELQELQAAGSSVLLLQGHLFDSGLINQSLDIIEAAGGNFCVLHMDVRPNAAPHEAAADSFKSRAWVQLSLADREELEAVIRKVDTLASVLPTAQASVEELVDFCPEGFSRTLTSYGDHAGDYATTSGMFRGGAFLPSSEPGTTSHAAPTVYSRTDGAAPKRVLMLGAGLVAAPAVEFLSRSGLGHHVTVASALGSEAEELLRRGEREWAGERDVHALELDVTREQGRLAQHVQEADIVLSLLPASLHHPVAEACIEHGTALVTASYVDERMQSLHKAAADAGVPILCEMGLDPGMDHMSAMAVIHEVQRQGGEITAFSSVCGGLPAPEAADNPIGYKFSWSPRGVLTASTNNSRYLEQGEVIDVDGSALLSAARPVDVLPSLNLEHLPNRDSLPYSEIYGIESAHSVYRGTLRYGGFCDVMHDLAQHGFLDLQGGAGAGAARPALLRSWANFQAPSQTRTSHSTC